jgi:hypothetical protein
MNQEEFTDYTALEVISESMVAIDETAEETAERMVSDRSSALMASRVNSGKSFVSEKSSISESGVFDFESTVSAEDSLSPSRRSSRVQRRRSSFVGSTGDAVRLVSSSVKGGSKQVSRVMKDGSKLVTTSVKGGSKQVTRAVKDSSKLVTSSVKDGSKQVTKAVKGGSKQVSKVVKDGSEQFVKVVKEVNQENLRKVGEYGVESMKSVTKKGMSHVKRATDAAVTLILRNGDGKPRDAGFVAFTKLSTTHAAVSQDTFLTNIITTYDSHTSFRRIDLTATDDTPSRALCS